MNRNMNNHIKLYSIFFNNTVQTIQVGSICAIDADDKHPHGYHRVGFTSSPYTLKENKTFDGKFIESSELVSNGYTSVLL